MAEKLDYGATYRKVQGPTNYIFDGTHYLTFPGLMSLLTARHYPTNSSPHPQISPWVHPPCCRAGLVTVVSPGQTNLFTSYEMPPSKMNRKIWMRALDVKCEAKLEMNAFQKILLLHPNPGTRVADGVFHKGQPKSQLRSTTGPT
jgi:hypothetical protein